MARHPSYLVLLALFFGVPAHAQDVGLGEGGTQADAERMLQGYLAMWSDDAQVNAATVDRFYAPQVAYYGQSWSRGQVLADKRAFIQNYPRRSYRELPGTFTGSCNGDRSRCRVTAEIEWRRTDRRGVVTAGRSRLSFDFVPAEGGRKIAREAAQTLSVSRG